MRTVKFRAWDKSKNDWIRWLGNKITEFTPDMFLDDNTCTESPDDIVWVEYTGLTDKNGKEIYEGDIVRIEGGFVSALGVTNIDEVHEVKFGQYRNGGEYKVGHVSTGYGWIETTSSWLEVIGNVYENPELKLRIKEWKQNENE